MNFEKIIDKTEIEDRVNSLSKEVENFYGDEKLTIVCVLKGSILFTSDFIREIDLDFNLEFMKVSSYRGTKREKIKSIDKIDFEITGKNILIVEDIVDSGNTLDFILNELKKNKPKSIKIITLLHKPDVYNFDMKIDWIGFNIKNDFVVGYGMDLDEKYRNKKSIYKISDDEE